MVQSLVSPDADESQRLGKGSVRVQGARPPHGFYDNTLSIRGEDWAVSLSRQREEFASLIDQLTSDEVAEMLLDFLVASCAAIQNWRIDHLQEELNSWLATAEVLIETRDDKDDIIKARQEALGEITDSRSVHDQ